MKNIFISLPIIGLFFMLLLFPQEVFQGASDGLLLWFQIVLPTLLPFMIFTNLLIHTNAISYIARTLGAFLKRLFHISSSGSFSVLAGFLCGYPMGAKVTADLITTGHISKKEGGYLLSFCNNTSPMFFISYVVLQNFKRESLILPSICILFFTPVLCSFLFRICYRQNAETCTDMAYFGKQDVYFNFQIFDNCMMNAFETITKVGGYIILFSILLTLSKNIPFQNLLPLLEITNGIPLIMKNAPSFEHAYIYAMALASFGGFCSIAQTKSMIQETGLSIFPYIIEKLITALVTSLFAFLYLKYISPR